MPKILVYSALIVILLAMVPPAVIGWARLTRSDSRRIHLVQDMDNQHRFKAQQVNEAFADKRAMRPPVEGTVARGELETDPHYFEGIVDGAWATTFPKQASLTVELMQRGRERFNIYCTPCHGHTGTGDGLVSRRASQLMNNAAGPVNGTTWVAPKNLHEEAIIDQPHGKLFHSITHGVRNMPAYGDQIPLRDRWAIVAYVRALQRSQNAQESDIPPEHMRRMNP